MAAFNPAELKNSLNRMAKIDVDSGHAGDFETAISRLAGFRVGIEVGPEIASSAPHQAALLTMVNISRRFALGGVHVSGMPDGPLLVGSNSGRRLFDEISRLGGSISSIPDGAAIIQVGTCPKRERSAIATFEGWRGGIVRSVMPRLAEKTTVIPAAVLAGAFAAGEAFGMLRNDVEAGRRSLGLSLWKPDAESDWSVSESDGPELEYLPDHLWILGLGHIGQAFLWTLSLCPFSRPEDVRLVLQDMDIVTESTDSTSILTNTSMTGKRKTRALAVHLEDRGFRTSLIERPFDGNFGHDVTIDPPVLVCGVDNALARSQMERPGFPFIVEGGIGHRVADYQAMRVHTFPSDGKSAADIWNDSDANDTPSIEGAAYDRLAKTGSDICGLTMLADTAVGAPFVGTVTAALMIAQILKPLCGETPYRVIDLNLKSVRSRRAIMKGAVANSSISFQPVLRPSSPLNSDARWSLLSGKKPATDIRRPVTP